MGLSRFIAAVYWRRAGIGPAMLNLLSFYDLFASQTGRDLPRVVEIFGWASTPVWLIVGMASFVFLTLYGAYGVVKPRSSLNFKWDRMTLTAYAELTNRAETEATFDVGLQSMSSLRLSRFPFKKKEDVALKSGDPFRISLFQVNATDYVDLSPEGPFITVNFGDNVSYGLSRGECACRVEVFAVSTSQPRIERTALLYWKAGEDITFREWRVTDGWRYRRLVNPR